MKLFFQEASWFLVLVSWRQIRRCEAVLFFEPKDFSSSHFPELPGKGLGRLIRWINPKVRFERLSDETYLSLWLDNNATSDQEVNRIFNSVAKSASYTALSRVLGAPGLECYYKIKLLPWILSRTLYYRIARHLMELDAQVRLIPANTDPYGFHPGFFSNEEFRSSVPPEVKQWLLAKKSFTKARRIIFGVNPLQGLLYCVQPLIQLLMAGKWTLRPAASVKADLVAPIISGFAQNSFKGAGHGDSFFLGSTLTPERALFYFGSRKFSRKEKDLQIAFMRSGGIRFTDPDEFKADPRFLKEILGLSLRFLQGLVHFKALAEDSRFVRVAGAFVRQYVRELLFARRVDFKVSVEFQDYSSDHVVRTLVANRLGRLTVGMHHGSPGAYWAFPVLRYTYVNRHCVWGEAFLRMHQGHWNRMECVPVGDYRLDAVLENQSPEKLKPLSLAYHRMFTEKRPLILLLLPSMGWHILPSRIQALLQGLRDLRQLPGDFHLVIRSRSQALREQWMNAGLRQILEADSRLIEDSACFTTNEWMALCDFVVTGGHSTGILEAAGAGKGCATFDYTLSGERAFGRYGQELILKESQDLVRLVRNLQQAKPIDSSAANRLLKDYSFFSDGRSTERFRAVLEQSIALAQPASHEPAAL